MIKTAHLPQFSIGRRPGVSFVGSKEVSNSDMRHTDFHVQTISCSFGYEPFRASDIRHIASLKQKKDDTTKSKQTKGILKNSGDAQVQNSTLPVPDHQKLDITKLHYMLKKRKNGSKENLSVRGMEKSEKKVKFDDKLNRLEELGLKYKVNSEGRVNTEPSCIRHQRRIEKLALRNNEKRESGSKESLVHISTIYDLKEKRPISPQSISKTTSSDSMQVNDRRSSLNSVQNSHGHEDFVRMDFNEQTPILSYNPRFSNFCESKENSMEERMTVNEAEQRLVQKGIPVFNRAGRYIKPSEIIGDTSNKQQNSEDNAVNKPSYRLPNDVKNIKRKEQDSLTRQLPSGQNRLQSKTTTNTCGGAVVTRSRPQPFMFSRIQQEPEPVHLNSVDQRKNYCDEGKTSQIMRWLRDISDVQAKEGFCTVLPERDIG